MATAPAAGMDTSQTAQLLLADLDHFTEFLWRNEELGEKRLSFFVTLVTAVAAGLIALTTATDSGVRTVPEPTLRTIAGTAGMGLLLLGLLSYLRMLQRNRVTDEYKRTLDYIRKRLASYCPDLKASGYVVPQRSDKRLAKWLRGGYAETVGAIDGVILSASLMVFQIGALRAAAFGVTLTVLLWVLAGLRKKPGAE